LSTPSKSLISDTYLVLHSTPRLLQEDTGHNSLSCQQIREHVHIGCVAFVTATAFVTTATESSPRSWNHTTRRIIETRINTVHNERGVNDTSKVQYKYRHNERGVDQPTTMHIHKKHNVIEGKYNSNVTVSVLSSTIHSFSVGAHFDLTILFLTFVFS